MNINYQGKYFSVLGDSVSTLVGYNPSECEVFYGWSRMCQAGIQSSSDTWWGQVIEVLGGRLLVNHSWAGSLVCKHPLCEIQSYGCSDARTSALGGDGQVPDVIMVLLGINDWGHGMCVFPEEGASDLAVFSVAYEAMLNKLRQNYPEAEIWCITLPRCETGERAFPHRRADRHFDRYCEAICTCGEKAGCRVLDISRTGELYELFDDYHPSAKGMKTISAAVLRALEERGPTDDH